MIGVELGDASRRRAFKWSIRPSVFYVADGRSSQPRLLLALQSEVLTRTYLRRCKHNYRVPRLDIALQKSQQKRPGVVTDICIINHDGDSTAVRSLLEQLINF
jgi:hypothetical protein